MRSRFLTAVLCTLALPGLGACASSPATDAPASAHSKEGDRHMVLAAGHTIELTLDVPSSAAPLEPIVVTFAASAPISWNIQSSTYGAPMVLVEGSDSAHVIHHRPNEPGPLSLLWENRSEAAINATFRVNGLPTGTTARWSASAPK